MTDAGEFLKNQPLILYTRLEDEFAFKGFEQGPSELKHDCRKLQPIKTKTEFYCSDFK